MIKKYSGKITLWSGLLFIASLTIWDASFWEIPKPKDIINSFPDITLIQAYLYKNAFRLYIGLVGTIFFIALFEFLSEKLTFPEKSKILCKYGAETLGIYVLQTFILEIAMKRYLNFDGYNFYLFNFVIAPALSFVTLFLCLGIIQMIKKSTLLSFFLLGKPLENIGETAKNHPKSK